MSLSIYLDDCAFSYRLRQVLLDAGYIVQVPADVDPPLTGAEDALHFAHIQAIGWVILTYNPKDFRKLHNLIPDHPGILVVYRDNDPHRDMTYTDIVRAIRNLQQIQPVLAGGFWVLNGYQW
ncbi:MAG: DUF5615 family PIN-like protein [Chloroflexi bacterium]|nr:DUF5615 family PIN-like protein [Chloroflexota bacterium]